MLDAFILDVDGTLIDTNDAHVDAWLAALESFGYHVSRDRIAVEIGKGGDKLVPDVLGQAIDKKHGDGLRKAQPKEFKKITEKKRLAAFPGTEALLAELRRRGMKTVLATSSGQGQLDATQKSAGVDLTKGVDKVVNADDIDESKPAPDLVGAAAKKLKLSPAQCVMLGDTPYDVEAARDAGVVCLGLTCGGMNDEKTLRGSGARAVYRDPADLLKHLDDALRVASPGQARLTAELAEGLMRQALAVAREAIDQGEVPIGCVLARGDGTVIARGHNELNASGNKTAHAEMVTFARAAGKVPPDARDLILVSTLEPCVMCLGASMEAAVDTILYALHAPADGGAARVRPPVSPESQMPRLWGGLLPDESRDLFKRWLKKGQGSPQQAAFVKQLLEMT